MSLTFDQLEQALNSMKAGSFNDTPFAYVPKNARVYCVPVFDPRTENPLDGLRAETWDYYQRERNTGYMMWFAVLAAEGGDSAKLPPVTPTDTDGKQISEDRHNTLANLAKEGFTHLAVPFKVGITVARPFLELFREKYQYAELNDDGSLANEPDVFVINRDDTGAKTTYSVSTTRRHEINPDMRVYLPEQNLVEMAQEHGELKDRMLEKEIEESGGVQNSNDNGKAVF